MKQADKKDALTELQNLLNSVVISDNLHSKEILDISIKLDNLIVEYYLDKAKGKENCYSNCE